MRRKLVVGFIALACCAETSSTSVVANFAGRYDRPFIYKQIGADGRCCSAQDHLDDVVEVVPVSSDAAYFRLSFIAGDEEECGISGVAHVEGHRLVYYDPNKPSDGGAACKITIERADRDLSILDRNGDDSGACSRMYCGARGFLGNRLRWSSKRPIEYIGRLEGSSQYRDAVNEWKSLLK